MIVRLTRACAVFSRQMNKNASAVNMAASDNAAENDTEGRNDQETATDDVMPRHCSSTGRNNGTLMQNAKKESVSSRSNRLIMPRFSSRIMFLLSTVRTSRSPAAPLMHTALPQTPVESILS